MVVETFLLICRYPSLFYDAVFYKKHDALDEEEISLYVVIA